MSETTPTNEPTKSKMLDPKANVKALVRIAVIIVILIAGIWVFFRFTAGAKTANNVTAAILQRPIELKNSVENLPASSFKALGVNLPYTGTLTIEASVIKGNDVTVAVVEESQLDAIKAKKQFKQFTDFQADKTKNYKRSARLGSGRYYIVFLDTSLGILSASSSDFKILAKLEP